MGVRLVGRGGGVCGVFLFFSDCLGNCVGVFVAHHAPVCRDFADMGGSAGAGPDLDDCGDVVEEGVVKVIKVGVGSGKVVTDLE
jgi:hypothetical protein